MSNKQGTDELVVSSLALDMNEIISKTITAVSYCAQQFERDVEAILIEIQIKAGQAKSNVQVLGPSGDEIA